MRFQTLASLEHIDPASWNALAGVEQPFLRHEFLLALERHHCVGAASGWVPHHLILRAGRNELLGALPLYRKLHSWGEFVFDFAWAQAYAQNGLAYYPKLLSAIPFTPATGPRLLASTPELRQRLADEALRQVQDEGLSSFHVLFPNEGQAEELRARGLLLRRDCQFHWHNRGYADFDAFLAEFTAEKRKKAKRERRRIAEAGIHFQTLSGGDIDSRLWRTIYGFHADTFRRHGHMPYLSREFFEDIGRALPEAVVVQLALHGTHPVAAAICFRSDDTLYGRYWGSSENFHSLHFETCYYQGIDYCIRNGLQRFEPGTQGEHKVARGFVPSYTASAHWIADPRFRRAIADYLERERDAVTDYAVDIQGHVPYRAASMDEPS